MRVSSAPHARSARSVARVSALEEGDCVELEVEGLGFGGIGIAHDSASGLAVLLDPGVMTLPGARLTARVTQVKARHARAAAEGTMTPSVHQVPSPCIHFSAETCGGCTALSLAYLEQVVQKGAQVAHLFRSVVAGGDVRVEPLVAAGTTERYRNKSEFFFDPRTGAVGMHPPRRPDVVTDLPGGCLLQSESADAALEAIRVAYAALGPASELRTRGKGLCSASVRTGADGEVLLNVVVNTPESVEAVRSELLPRFLDAIGAMPWATTTIVVATVEPAATTKSVHRQGSRRQGGRRKPRERRIHEKQVVLHGDRPWVIDTLCGLRFRVSASSFFQTNPAQATLLYDAAVAATLELSSMQGGIRDRPFSVLDLYCGTGTIGLCVAHAAASKGIGQVHVVGLEQSASAVADAEENARTNNVANTQFVQCDLAHADLVAVLSGLGGSIADEKASLSSFPSSSGGPPLELPDVVITDPPRGGMSAKCISDLRRLGPERIVYVSCNPSTQARDVAALCDPGGPHATYALTRVQPFDLFPHTPHIETVAVLDRAGGTRSAPFR